jgi:D-alanyl-D-alanine carboxypeptidase (penicillin-binding protein 5/6)
MFIEEGQKVSIMELLKGLALPSGNDAGIAVAEFVTGSIPEFVELMNLEVGKLGLSSTHFADSSGYSENNRTTAREYAAFCTFYLREHPETIEQLHSLESFTYPEDHNLSEGGNSVHGPITQGNHNVLIGRLKNIDGLKTGYIDESGYNLAASAEFDGRRFILVTMGGPGRNTQDGLLRRAIDGTALFNYGFYGWTTLSPEVPETGLLKILGGEKNELDITYSPAENITIQSAEAASLVCIEKWNEIIYPVEKGAIIGSWQLSGSGGKVYQSGVITADERLNKGNIFKRFLDRFRSAE